MLQKAVQESHIRGYSLCKNGPKVTHLFFAYDNLLFCQARLAKLEVNQDILAMYEQASRQQINREKTTLFFSKADAEETKEEITNFLGVPEIKEYEKYLGLPTVMGRNKKASLNYIKEMVWSKLQRWKERLLSQAEREVLLKAVVQAIPTFAMSCFKLPARLCHDIEMLIQKFWWGESGDRRKIHWKNWETLRKHKSDGVLGFKDLVKFNEAMLAKQMWRLMSDRTSLFFRVFSAKFFPSRLVFDAKKSKGSYTWQSVQKARNVIEKGMLWRIRDRNQVPLFHDNWIPGKFPTKAVPSRIEALSEAKVSTMIDPKSKEWNVELLRNFIAPFLAHKILSISIYRTVQDDILVWPRSKCGSYMVRTGYQLLCELENSEGASSSNPAMEKAFWNCLWNLNPKQNENIMLACLL